MIPRELLSATESRGVGLAVYGATGLKKTHAIHTLVPPILMLDIGEGGSASVLPWIARRKEADAHDWTAYSQEQRESFVGLLSDSVRTGLKYKANPWIDLIHYDNMNADTWTLVTRDIGNFDYTYYNSIAVDSLQEMSVDAQSFSKGKGNETAEMHIKLWGPVQERTAIALRLLKNYRDKGVVVYTTSSEDIQKDYVKEPRELKPGDSVPEPYSVRGSVNLPGKLVAAFPHMPDIVCHVRLLNGNVTWVTQPEPLPGGSAWWDGKDRFGRLDKYESPDFRLLAQKLWGQEGARAIYARAKEQVQARG